VSKCLEWHAWYNRMPGALDKLLHISGRFGCSSSATEVILEPGIEDQWGQPGVVRSPGDLQGAQCWRRPIC
jgi:hypothetical protein